MTSTARQTLGVLHFIVPLIVITVAIIQSEIHLKCSLKIDVTPHALLDSQGKIPPMIPLNEDGDLLLHMACQWGDVEIVRYLVCDQQCDVTVQNKSGDSPLLIACCNKVLDIVKFLLQQRCDTTVRNKRGQSPLTIPLNKNGDLLLHMACRWRDLKTVKYLVCEQHCDVNVQNKNGDSPLHIACHYKGFHIIKFLL